jgi:orotidine-5'-phosphate decarboxylase
MTFLDKIRAAQWRSHTMLCIGLDIDHTKIPEQFRSERNPQAAFNRAIVTATSEFACAYKLNTAYYEANGTAGLEAIEETLNVIPQQIFTIADCKRGDIGATSDQYRNAWFGRYTFDAVTLSPYMGYDSVETFLSDDARGAFFLGLTSNPGARDFQYLELAGGKRLYEHVTDTINDWNKPHSNCGLVVGATKPEELAALRNRAPHLPFLIPGVGAQGGSIDDVITANNGGIALINVSRGITAATGNDIIEAIYNSAKNYATMMSIT